MTDDPHHIEWHILWARALIRVDDLGCNEDEASG